MKQGVPQESFQEKIILLTHEYPPFRGGVATYCYEATKAFQDFGISFEIWAPRHLQSPESYTPLDCGNRLSPWNLLKMTLSIYRRENQIKGANLILGSVMAHRAVMLLSSLGKLRECQIHSLVHGSEILKFQRNPFWKFLADELFKKVKNVFVASEFSRKLVLQYYPKAQITLAPCAVGSLVAKNISSKKSNSFRILTLARIHPRKGQLETAKALALLPENLKQKIIYRIAGGGDQRYLQSVLSFCEENKIKCEYLGKINDDQTAQTYADSDLFVMTSKTMQKSIEGFGITYLEAGWHGKPSIAFDSGGVSEAVLHDKTGILVKEGDLGGAAKAVQELIENPELLHTLGKNAAEFARSFSWKNTAKIIYNAVNGKETS